MENKKATKLIESIVKDLESNQIITNDVVEMVKELRPFAVEESLPVVAKTLRLVYEHIKENEVFAIPIPQDEPLTDEEIGEEIEPVIISEASGSISSPISSSVKGSS